MNENTPETVASFDKRTGTNYIGDAYEGLAKNSRIVHVGHGRRLKGYRSIHDMAATSDGWQATHTLYVCDQ